MRRWVANKVAPLEPAQTYRLKGSFGIDPPANRTSGAPVGFGSATVSNDSARFQVELTPDFVRPITGVQVTEIWSFFALPRISNDFSQVRDPVELKSGFFERLLVIQVGEYPANLAPPVDVSPIPVEPFSLPEIRDAPPFPLPTISENKFRPIDPVVVNGKDYRGRRDAVHDSKQRDLFNRKAEHPPALGFRKAYRESNERGSVSRQVLTIWDLLWPLLQRPLNIEAATLDFPNEIYGFQVQGIKSLIRSKSFLLADEMGTGKTVMASVALRLLCHQGKVNRALILCPKSVLGVWDNHLRDWASSLSVTVVSGPAVVRAIDWRCPAHVYVATYDTLRNDLKRERHERQSPLEKAIGGATFDLIIADEAHAIKNPASGRAKAVLRLAHDAKFRWALTGTPIQNSLDDLRAIFAFVKPKLFSKDGTISTTDARRKIEPYFLRRRKKEVFPDLPPKLLSDEWLELDSEQEAEYNEALRQGRHEFTTGRKEFTRQHVFALLTRLKQICNFATESSTSPKSDALLDLLEEIVANEKKVLVFSQYREHGTERLEPILRQFGVVKVTGESSSRARSVAIDEFQNEPSKRAFLATVKSMSEGVTLTAASFVIHFDHWWNPAVGWQAEDRAHRKGQAETVNIYSFWMRGTIEERIRKILERKGLLHDEVVDALSEKELDQAFTMADLLEILELERESVTMPEWERAADDPWSVLAIRDRLASLEPAQFEHAVMQVFRDVHSYANARVVGRAGDGGVDIEATKMVLGKLERVVIQCKRMASVGPSVARELLGVLAANQRLTKGLLVTSGVLTRACRDFCAGQRTLEGVDGVQLAKWIRDCKINIAGVTADLIHD